MQKRYFELLHKIPSMNSEDPQYRLSKPPPLSWVDYVIAGVIWLIFPTSFISSSLLLVAIACPFWHFGKHICIFAHCDFVCAGCISVFHFTIKIHFQLNSIELHEFGDGNTNILSPSKNLHKRNISWNWFRDVEKSCYFLHLNLSVFAYFIYGGSLPHRLWKIKFSISEAVK